MVKVQQFDICLIRLDPTIGSEIRKKRPCIVISPNSMNESRIIKVMGSAHKKETRHKILNILQIMFS